MLLQGNTAGHHADGSPHAIALEGIFHLLSGGHQGADPLQAALGQHLYQIVAQPFAGDQIGGHVLLIQGVVGMYDGGTGDFGNPGRKLVAEKFALAVHHIRLPVDDLLDQLVPEGSGHPQIRVDALQRHGADIIDRSLLMGVQIAGNGQYPHIMTVGGQFIEQILHRGHNAVGGDGIQVRGDQNFQFGFLEQHGNSSVLVTPQFSAKLQNLPLRQSL